MVSKLNEEMKPFIKDKFLFDSLSFVKAMPIETFLYNHTQTQYSYTDPSSRNQISRNQQLIWIDLIKCVVKGMCQEIASVQLESIKNN